MIGMVLPESVMNANRSGYAVVCTRAKELGRFSVRKTEDAGRISENDTVMEELNKKERKSA